MNALGVIRGSSRLWWVRLFVLCAVVWVGTTLEAQAACEKPDLLMVLDRSCSMSGSKWSAAVSAVNTITSRYATKLRFGLETFESSSSINYGIDKCAREGTRCPANLRSTLSRIRVSGGTNLKGAINTASAHLNFVRLLDSAKNRKRVVMFITDGQAGCADREVRNLSALLGVKTYVIGFGSGVSASCLNSMAVAGRTARAGSRRYYQANSSSELNSAMAAIANAASTEICNNLDDDCDGQVDEGLRQSCRTACGAGTQVCSRGKWGACSAGSGAREKCNGKDDDCDGRADEDWPQKGRSCSAGLGLCRRNGVYRCNGAGTGVECSVQPGPRQAEKCDGQDNDCDGQVDENWAQKGKPCTSGSGACGKNGRYICKPDGSGIQCSATGGQPKPETCNGKDDDCDGLTDEKLQRACRTACGSGLEECKNGKFVNCNAPQPKAETCNGRDDDCNGQTDEGLTRKCKTKCGEGTETCKNGSYQGCTAQQPKAEECNGKDDDCNGQTDDILPKNCAAACGKGVAVCEKGKWGGCSGRQAQPETCNGKDDDCNGKIDDGVFRECKTGCGKGREVCVNGRFGGCTAPLPQPELCNGKDDNCDGVPDNNPICPAGLTCQNGRCLKNCVGGECRGKLRCEKGLCVGDPCATLSCPGDSRCVGGRCIKPCDLIKCAQGTVCSRGQCVRNDCYLKGCPSGERCVNGACQSDPCASKQCAKGQFCRNGNCIPLCSTVTCEDQEKCVDGRCVADPRKSGACAGKTCAKSQICDNGKCVSDPCRSIFCGKGRACIEGKCEQDPCLNIKCPSGSACREGQCTKPGGGTKPGDEKGGQGEKGGAGEKGVGPGPDGGSGNPDDPSANIEKGPGTPDNNTVKESEANSELGQTGGGGRRYDPGGCCQIQKAPVPWGPATICFVFFLGLLLRRRSRR